MTKETSEKLSHLAFCLVRQNDERINNEINKDNRLNPNNKDYFTSIPSNPEHLAINLEKIIENFNKTNKKTPYKELTFLDVGCGTGTTIQIAENLGYKARGIEYNLLMKPIHEQKGIDVWYGDALNYIQYHEADVIYYYRPIYNDEIQKNLEHKIETEAKRGAFIIALAKRDLETTKNPNFQIIEKDTYTYGQIVFKKQ